MSTLKLSGLNSGSSIIKAPDSGSTGVTFTLPASAGTLVTSADVTNKLPLAGGTMTGDLDISDTGAGALTVGGTTNAYSAPVLFTVSDIGLDVTDGTKHLASWASHGGSSHTGSAIGTRSNHDLALITNDTKRVVINTAGVVSIPQGIELGSGIDATAANTLDDYEEGTWSPDLVGHTGSAGSHAHNLTGHYIKIGGLVWVRAYGYLTNKGSYSGDARLNGLPFAPDYATAGTLAMFPSTEVDANMRTISVTGSTTKADFMKGSRLDIVVPWSEIVTSYYLSASVVYAHT